MSEPASLGTDEPLAERIGRHWFDRLIMPSDGVFAIAVTLLALAAISGGDRFRPGHSP